MSRPINVGIVAMDMYFPSTYVKQSDLEVFDGVSSGKYTVGLGQTSMAFCDDLEDINSICLTATHNLLGQSWIFVFDVCHDYKPLRSCASQKNTASRLT
jgi:hydroxymethylglutaryl-CoA synthase